MKFSSHLSYNKIEFFCHFCKFLDKKSQLLSMYSKSHLRFRYSVLALVFQKSPPNLKILNQLQTSGFNGNFFVGGNW